MDQAEPSHDEVVTGISHTIRDLLAYLIKIERAELRPELIREPDKIKARPFQWKPFFVTDFFDLLRGHFHSIANLDPGQYPTISRVGTDNGLETVR